MGQFALAALSGLASVRAGQQQEVNYQMQADQERFAARDREVQRRRRIVAALASQNACRGATGVRAFEGSPAAMMKNDQALFEYDQSMASSNTSMRQQTLLTSGKHARQYGVMSGATTLLDYANKTAERGTGIG